MSTPHPCVITTDHRSKPRVLFSGTQLVEVDLPVGTRVIYPKPPWLPCRTWMQRFGMPLITPTDVSPFMRF